jgi:hypothetical protein
MCTDFQHVHAVITTADSGSVSKFRENPLKKITYPDDVSNMFLLSVPGYWVSHSISYYSSWLLSSELYNALIIQMYLILLYRREN